MKLKNLFEKNWNDKIVIIDELETFYYNVKNGCINIIKWLPIIWNDRDWDYDFLLRMMEFKLNNMSKCFKKHGNHTQSSRDAKDIKKCAELIRRIYKDEYESKELESHDKKWGEIKISSVPVDYEFSEMIIERDNVITEKDDTDQKREFRNHIDNAWKKKDQDMKEAFRLMCDRILYWWD